jgi:putative ABC transport system substrate-binding protein
MNEILERAHARRLPVFAPFRPAALAGALVSYGLDVRMMLGHAAAYADRLPQGAKPAELPVEQPTHFELAVNLKRAKVLGVRLPQSLHLWSDEVIE